MLPAGTFLAFGDWLLCLLDDLGLLVADENVLLYFLLFPLVSRALLTDIILAANAMFRLVMLVMLVIPPLFLCICRLSLRIFVDDGYLE